MKTFSQAMKHSLVFSWLLVVSWIWWQQTFAWEAAFFVGCLVLRMLCLGKGSWRVVGVTVVMLGFIQWRLTFSVLPLAAEQSTYQLRYYPSETLYRAGKWQGQGWLIQTDEQDQSQAIKVRFSYTQQVENEGQAVDGGAAATSSSAQAMTLPIDYWATQAQEIQVVGKLRPIAVARNFDVFDFAAYMRQQGIQQQLQIEQVVAEQSAAVDPEWLGNIREKLRAPFRVKTDAIWPNVLAKLVLNQNSASYQELRSLWTLLGVAHLFAISGFHLYYLKRLFVGTMWRFGVWREVAEYLAFVLLVGYSWLCGWPIGAVRVLGLEALRLVMRKKEHAFNPLTALSLVGLICLGVKPFLSMTIGYLLSFGVSLLLYFCRPVGATLTPLARSVWTTTACLLFSWPCIMVWYHEWYPLQWLWVLVVGLLFERVVMPLALFGVIGLVMPTAVSALYFQLFEQGIQLLSEWGRPLLPLLRWHLVIGKIGLGWWLLLMSAVYIWLLPLRVPVTDLGHPVKCQLGSIRFRSTSMVWRGVYVLSAYCLVALVRPYCHLASVTILDVGQGDALLYRPAWQNQAWLIDTGGRADRQGKVDFDYAKYNLLPALKAQGIGHLTGVLITHPDLDHIGNLATLAQEVAIEQLYLTDYTMASATFQQLAPAISPKTQQVRLVSLHRYPITPDLSFYTNDYQESTESNDTSVAATIRLGSWQLLNLGDMSAPYEQQLLQRYPEIQADAIKLAHHGSKYSTSEFLLQRLQPQFVLISAGAHNRYGHPSTEVLTKLNQYGIPAYQTNLKGAIRLHTLFNRLQIEQAISK